jgi:hypothetical protein
MKRILLSSASVFCGLSLSCFGLGASLLVSQFLYLGFWFGSGLFFSMHVFFCLKIWVAIWSIVFLRGLYLRFKKGCCSDSLKYSAFALALATGYGVARLVVPVDYWFSNGLLSRIQKNGESIEDLGEFATQAFESIPVKPLRPLYASDELTAVAHELAWVHGKRTLPPIYALIYSAAGPAIVFQGRHNDTPVVMIHSSVDSSEVSVFMLAAFEDGLLYPPHVYQFFNPEKTSSVRAGDWQFVWFSLSRSQGPITSADGA